MRIIFLILLMLFVLTFTACSYSTDFVVTNESNHPIEVRYKVKNPSGPLALTDTPSKIMSSQLSSREWKKLDANQYQIDQENHTIIVSVMPSEALLVTSMFHYIGDEDPNDVTSWPIDEISVNGADGEMRFTGQKARKSFSYVSRVLYTLTYK